MHLLTGNRGFIFATILLLSVFLHPLRSLAAPVAVIVDSSLKPYAEALAGFKEEFRGEVDVFETTKYNASSLARMLDKREYAAIAAIGAEPLKNVAGLKGIPIVTGMVVNPLAFPDIDRSGISGVTLTIPPLASLRTLKQIAPSVRRVGVVYNPAQSSQLLREAMKDAASLEIELIMRSVETPNQAVDAFKSLESHVDAFLLVPDMVAINAVSLDYLLLSSFRHRLPVVGFSSKYVKMGALLSLSFDERDIGRQMAEIARRIVQGEPAKSVLFVHPRKFSIDVNSRTAESLGITIPAKVLKEVNVYTP
ncbi:MAG: hypothetical protein OEV28_02795 [Nitrospirota bacterium]|nr:hypothetical protein [Nitrospirota bacterium]